MTLSKSRYDSDDESTSLASHASNDNPAGEYDGISDLDEVVDNATYRYTLECFTIGGGWHSAGLLATRGVVIVYTLE